jgi:hypothetical protein
MYTHNGQDIFVVDGHMHLWDASPENQLPPHGKNRIDCFYAYHSGLSPADAKWPYEKFCQYGETALIDDLFIQGYVDVGILNSTGNRPRVSIVSGTAGIAARNKAWPSRPWPGSIAPATVPMASGGSRHRPPARGRSRRHVGLISSSTRCRV